MGGWCRQCPCSGFDNSGAGPLEKRMSRGGLGPNLRGRRATPAAVRAGASQVGPFADLCPQDSATGESPASVLAHCRSLAGPASERSARYADWDGRSVAGELRRLTWHGQPLRSMPAQRPVGSEPSPTSDGIIPLRVGYPVGFPDTPRFDSWPGSASRSAQARWPWGTGGPGTPLSDRTRRGLQGGLQGGLLGGSREGVPGGAPGGPGGPRDTPPGPGGPPAGDPSRTQAPTSVPTGRVIKYPPKCTPPRGAPPGPPSGGVPGGSPGGCPFRRVTAGSPRGLWTPSGGPPGTPLAGGPRGLWTRRAPAPALARAVAPHRLWGTGVLPPWRGAPAFGVPPL